MTYFLTIIKVIDSDVVLEESFDSILKSKMYKEGTIQLLVVDLLRNKKTKEFIENNNLKDNLVSVDKDLSLPEIFNECKSKIEGENVNFSTSSTFVEKHTLESTYKYLETDNCVVLNLNYHPLDELKYTIKYIKSFNSLYSSKNNLSIEENIEFFNPLLDCYYFKYDLIKDIDFSKDEYNYSIEFIFDLLLKIKNFLFIDKICYYTNILENDFNNNHTQYLKEFYLEFMKDFVLPYIKKHNEPWIQNSLLYLVSIRYCSNLNARNKHVLNDKEVDKFEEYTEKFLEHIDYSTLKNFYSHYINSSLIKRFIEIKSNNHLKIDVEDDTLLLKAGDEVVQESDSLRVDTKTLEYDKGKLCIDAEILSSIFVRKKDQIVCYVNDKEYDYTVNDVYTYTKFFNRIYHKKYSFRVEIPLKKLNKRKNTICFSYKYGDYQVKLRTTFKTPSSKINITWKNSYFSFADKILTYSPKKEDIIVKKRHGITVVLKELGLLFEYLFRSKHKKKLGVKSFLLRTAYWVTRPYYKKKKVWISFDKLFKGGDNGEYYYHYVANNKDDVTMCYVINKDSADYKRLIDSNCKNILPFRSLRHYLAVLNCEYMFATHANPFDYNGFTSGVEKYFRDLLTFKTVCIQHGLSVNQIAKFQNRVYANTKLYFCASKYEIKNLSLPEYDYKDYNALKLTGVPRYDGLQNKDKKIILITPTWRQESSSKLVHLNMARQYNKDFKESVYYKVYNDLINDSKLIEAAKKYDYKIVYLLHPAISSQIDDFEKNEFVDVVAATSNMSYEKILTESSLMVTDYSGVQFDFAYMRKPIVYYHPTELPPHYEESCFIYDSMGFGPIIEKEDELVKTICDYMKTGCKMKEEYIARANDFFEYDDFNNCKRILEVIEEEKDVK